MPASQPLPASHKRRQAAEAAALIPGPIADPDGWFALPTASVRGAIDAYGERQQTVVDCTVSHQGLIPITLIDKVLSALSCSTSQCYLSM